MRVPLLQNPACNPRTTRPIFLHQSGLTTPRVLSPSRVYGFAGSSILHLQMPNVVKQNLSV